MINENEIIEEETQPVATFFSNSTPIFIIRRTSTERGIFFQNLF